MDEAKKSFWAYYAPHGERLNTLTHAAGAALSILGLVLMVAYASTQGDAYRIVGASVFGATMVFLYMASTLYHSSPHPHYKKFFKVVDHSCIYLLIAGTYTPFTLIAFRGTVGWALFGVVWGLAFCGVIFKIFLIHRFKLLSVGIYLGMGWLCIFAMKPMLQALPTPGIWWLVAGGLSYTLGVAFYLWKSLPHHHAVWHLFVMTGTFCHFASVYWFVLPPAA